VTWLVCAQLPNPASQAAGQFLTCGSLASAPLRSCFLPLARGIDAGEMISLGKLGFLPTKGVRIINLSPESCCRPRAAPTAKPNIFARLLLRTPHTSCAIYIHIYRTTRRATPVKFGIAASFSKLGYDVLTFEFIINKWILY
jgi:hypothetical protein